MHDDKHEPIKNDEATMTWLCDINESDHQIVLNDLWKHLEVLNFREACKKNIFSDFRNRLFA
jgi:hypothetical protein